MRAQDVLREHPLEICYSFFLQNRVVFSKVAYKKTHCTYWADTGIVLKHSQGRLTSTKECTLPPPWNPTVE